MTAAELLAAAHETPNWDEYRQLLHAASDQVLAERAALLTSETEAA